MLPKLRIFEYNYSTHQRIPQSYHKTSTRYYTNIQHMFKCTCGPHAKTTCNKSSRGLRLVQGLHYLVSHHGGLLQVLIELRISTIRLFALPKCIKRSMWPVGFYQPEYMSHVLSGGCGDIPFKTIGYFLKLPRQDERFVFTPFRDPHNLYHILGSTSKTFKFLLHEALGL